MSASRLPSMIRTVAKMTVPCSSGMSRFWIALIEILPQPGDREHALRHHRARQQPAHLRGHHRDDGDERVFERVLGDDGPLQQALAARRADVVVLHRLEQVGAHHAGDGARRRPPQHEGGQDQVREGLETRDGEEPELVGEQVLHEQSDPEHRHRDSRQREGHQGDVEGAVLFDGGDDARRDADGPGKEEGGQRQLDRVGKGVGDQVGDLPVHLVGVAEVAARGVGDVVDVADVPRVVEVHALAQVLHDGGADALLHHHRDGVARQDVEQEKDHKDDPEQDGDHDQDPLDDVLEHERPPGIQPSREFARNPRGA